MQVPMTCTYSFKVVAPQSVKSPNNLEEQQMDNPMTLNEPVIEKSKKRGLRRSQRERRPTISNDYVAYLQDSEVDLRVHDNDPVLFLPTINSDNVDKWLNAMKDELMSMEQNNV